MTWITQNKGVGPWGFNPQADKLGYVNNPRWTGAPASTIEHDPCGYWWQKRTPIVETFYLYGTGHNFYGNLGLGDYTVRWDFTPVGTDKDWIQVSAGLLSTNAIKKDGTLWSTGTDDYGQLGLDNVGNKTVFTRVGGSDWASVFCAGYHVFAIKRDGTLWGCGRNESGQLGLGDTIQRSTFVQIGVANNWKSASGSGLHSILTTTSGAVYGCGWNMNGELGTGDTASPYLTMIPILSSGANFGLAGPNCTYILRTEGTIWGTGSNANGKLGLGAPPSFLYLTQLGFASDWKSIASGNSGFLFAHKNNGELWSTGYNAFGQLGVGDYSNRNILTDTASGTWVEVCCGTNHAIAIKGDGTLWGTGYGGVGQLGRGVALGYTRNTFGQSGVDSDWKKLLARGSFASDITFALKTAVPSSTPTIGDVNPVWPMPS